MGLGKTGNFTIESGGQTSGPHDICSQKSRANAHPRTNGQSSHLFGTHLACSWLEMQVPGRQRVEVVINGNQNATNGSTAGRLRPLTVDEALQYSPLTTSVTSGYGIGCRSRSGSLADHFSERIPLPDLGQPQSSLGLIAETERTSLRKLLDRIPKVPPNGDAVDTQVDVLRTGLNSLLDPDHLSEL